MTGLINVFEPQQEENGEFVDMLFDVVEQSEDQDHLRLTCRATSDIGTVGFTAHVATTGWTSQVVEDDEQMSFWWGNIMLSTIGADSDRLLALLRARYGAKSGEITFTPQCGGLAVMLEGVPDSLRDRGVYRTKLFFNENSEVDEDYAELFFYFDLAAGVAALNEKDPEYRGAVLSALSGEAAA